MTYSWSHTPILVTPPLLPPVMQNNPLNEVLSMVQGSAQLGAHPPSGPAHAPPQ